MKTLGRRAQARVMYRVAVREHTEYSKRYLPRQQYGETLDHIVPKRFGFNKNISAKLIGSPENLRWIPAAQNIEKGSRITRQAIRILRSWGLDDLADEQERAINR